VTPGAKRLVNADAPYGGLTAQSRKEPTVIADLTQTSTADLQIEVAMLRRYAKTLALVKAELRRRNVCPTCDYPSGEPEPVRCPDCGH
jgi:rubrerythrin